MSEERETPPTDPPFPATGRLLGIDYGTVRWGIAVSTPDQTIAGPLENYQRRTERLDEAFLREIVAEYQIAGLVVGLPVHMSGDEGGKARECRAFGTWASRALALPVCYWDERFTSAVAEQILLEAGLSKKKRKARIDKLAAQILLQSFLDAGDRLLPPRAM